MKKGAIFDMDGLMFDTQKLYDETWDELAVKYGYQPGSGFINETRGMAGDKAEKLVSKYFPTVNPHDFLQEGIDRTSQKEETYVPKKPGLVELLDFLKEHGVRIAVASSSDSEMVNRNLRVAGVDAYPDYVICGDEVTHTKPEPEIFLKAAAHLGLSPEDCYVLEDSPNGILAAHRAACLPIMVPDMVQPDEETRDMCLSVCKSLLEVKEKMERGEI